MPVYKSMYFMLSRIRLATEKRAIVYRGLAKISSQINVLFAPANLYRVRQILPVKCLKTGIIVT